MFAPSADLAVRLGLAAVAGGIPLLIGLVWALPWTDHATGRGRIAAQPVPFSHQHHVSGLGLDCRYCHDLVEVSSTAGIPPVETCMTCHSQIWTNAQMLEPVRRSFATGEPLQWQRVNRLPDYVYFDHSIHVAKGVGCTTCHGPVGDMPLTWKGASLTMGWCLDCHRNPAPNLRPRAAVFDPHWRRTPDTPPGSQLMASYHVRTAGLTDCSVCHR